MTRRLLADLALATPANSTGAGTASNGLGGGGSWNNGANADNAAAFWAADGKVRITSL